MYFLLYNSESAGTKNRVELLRWSSRRQGDSSLEFVNNLHLVQLTSISFLVSRIYGFLPTYTVSCFRSFRPSSLSLLSILVFYLEVALLLTSHPHSLSLGKCFEWQFRSVRFTTESACVSLSAALWIASKSNSWSFSHHRATLGRSGVDSFVEPTAAQSVITRNGFPIR